MVWSGTLRKWAWAWLATGLIGSTILSAVFYPALTAAFIGVTPPALYFSWMLGVVRPHVTIGGLVFRKFPRAIWSKATDNSPQGGGEELANSAYVSVLIEHDGLKTAKDCVLVVELRSGGFRQEFKGRWSSLNNPTMKNLHPGDSDGCDLLRIRMESGVVEAPVAFLPIEERLKQEGQVAPGAWMSQEIPPGEYEVTLWVVAEDYRSQKKKLGRLSLPEEVLTKAVWADWVENLRRQGAYLEWQSPQGPQLDPDDPDLAARIKRRRETIY